MERETLWIIIGVVLGTLVLTAIVVVLLFCWKRSQRRVRGFSLRPVTPLDDAEFESWRRPSQHSQSSEKHGMQPAVVHNRFVPGVFEKELELYNHPRTPSPVDLTPKDSPSNLVRKPERVRRKSSVASSLADRPPTPYSPTSPNSNFNRGSYSPRATHVHYPSVSETSAFKFDLDAENCAREQEPQRWV